MATIADAAEALRQMFKFDSFREGQERVISRLLDGQSVLAVFPTGAGKSMCYQLPALLLDGLTLVVSPLIALMKDQIDFLISHGVAAARLDSSIDASEFRRVHDELRSGKLKLLYVAPERFGSERFLQTLKRLKLSMMAVDEAHCISEWGHNFRPDYLKLARIAMDLKVGRVLALTATATPAVGAQISKAFSIGDDNVIRTGFYRKNLELRVSQGNNEELARTRMLMEKLRSRPLGATIVYVTLQRTAEEVASSLRAASLDAKPYHAGLDADVRHEVQDWFMASSSPIVVATIAFGMGIDKADLRYVYHYNLPKSLENYAQEIGRSGRDGKPAVCEMLACARDVITLENFTYGDTPTPEAVSALMDEVLDAGELFDVSVHDLSGRHDIRPLVVETMLTYLELLGILQPTGPFYNEYKFQPLRDSAQILAKFDSDRQAFLRQIFACAERGKTWFKVDVQRLQQQTGYERRRIVSALNYLEEQGDLMLDVAGLRQGFRRVREELDRRGLSEKLLGRFIDRERRDIERLRQVMEFAGQDSCRWNYLAKYFGENRESNCNHCDNCAGQHCGPIRGEQDQGINETISGLVQALVSERYPALATHRQLARFLAGITSPGTSRSKLTKHRFFGSLMGVRFETILEFSARCQGC